MATANLLDANGNPIPGSAGSADPRYPEGSANNGGGSTAPAFNASAEIAKIFGGSGISAGETDAANLASKNPEDRAKFLADLTAQRDRRTAATFSNGGSGGDADKDGNRVADTGWAQNPNGQWTQTTAAPPTSGGNRTTTQPDFRNTSPYFTDPTQRLVEDTALARLQQLQRPDASSGQGLYEQYARQLFETLKAPVYSPSDEAALRAQAFDMLEKDRTATKQRYMQELSRRGIAPSSGVAMSGLLDIDKHYDGIRGQVTNQMAVAGINQTRQNRTQALDVLGGLAGAENTRLNQALNVSRIPYELGNDAFSMMQSAVTAGGNPSANVGTAIQLVTAIQNSQTLSANQRAAMLAQVFEIIGMAA